MVAPDRSGWGLGNVGERTVSSTGGGAPIITALAGLSLAVNLLAAGAYVGSTYFAARHDKPNLVDRRFTDLARKLAVPDSDPGLTDLHRSLKVALDVRHIRSQPLMEDLMAELAKPSPDPARIEALQEKLNGIRRTSSSETLTALSGFLDQATPEERKTLLSALADKDAATMPLRFGLVP